MVCWLPPVSHLMSFRPDFFPPEIAEATCCSVLYTTYLSTRYGGFLTATSWGTRGSPLNLSDTEDGSRLMNPSIFIPMTDQF